MRMCFSALAIILNFSSKRDKIVLAKHTTCVNNFPLFSNDFKSKALQRSFNVLLVLVVSEV